MFLLAHHLWGTFREEEGLRLSDRNSILMTQNLSRIRSEALIGRRSSFIVLAIVYEWQTKAQGPEQICLSLEHQSPSKTSEKMGYFDRVTVSLHIL